MYFFLLILWPHCENPLEPLGCSPITAKLKLVSVCRFKLEIALRLLNYISISRRS